jgi:lantibiotic modifying enzyme
MDLYGGLGGIAVFLAACARVLGEGRDTALRTVAALRGFAGEADLERLFREGYTIGGATGVGSVVYALTCCADLLDMPELLEDARACAALLDDAAFAADVENDVMAGTAGAVLGLLALHRMTGEAEILARARAGGLRLLERQAPQAMGATWRCGRQPPLTGLSHGAAGIALALARLAASTAEARFADAARAALAFEASQFDPSASNWRDLRTPDGEVSAFMNAWCHGALGIGLGRFALLPVLEEPNLQADAEAALRCNAGAPQLSKDTLCCGNLARVELLLAASRASLAPAEAAGIMAAQIADRATQRGGFSLSGRPGVEAFDPSFHQGLSGIGYQFLRLAEPDALPSVLVWE